MGHGVVDTDADKSESDGSVAEQPTSGEPAEPVVDRPEWDDEYFDRVAGRLMFNYDLERDYTVYGERFDLFGSMRMESQKQFIHQSINYANHHAKEYMFARRVDTATVPELERIVELGHTLADEWIEPDEEHFGTDFTFVLVADEVPETVREFVSGFSDRTLIKFGYYGHYEVNVAVVAPDDEDAIASQNADSVAAFTLWTDVSPVASGGLLQRLVERFRG
ncbi:hypothetical protein E6P09_02765 [Haloferax mediterranei ATCC 33500]|uniref:DUF8052 domain-containing protein n=1 Tax=Haloferax mediterranei (strain ATCC 33500 / DSM 1411 / JCM 8866 / NBRC 14739 / NCIMB 2177 / R-4) TaxID=523841 RepID=I3R8S0_HALMT|nr:hypothetical protein [Haloferax mediterranei]AFK20630.1 hypothetical protein HFX_2966 [Haloferax mediterranei ATCC 33500]AHZ22885.1 hypothetical protein BM92_09640 [Haloferax mediterranei ATCC 33500]EMA03050.1 hypothetical protein C439_10715 [Haloferax mediterranei ATCC 33500]MDX5987769.1 hypothetical protein [Haloferax mediterranei ATCC 33500]QCQ74248.1 hypothetical protein E6P09_02765 [Haloferax mediterranei ATCC 33500]